MKSIGSIMIFLILMSSITINAQTEETKLTKKEQRKNRPAYINLSAGFGKVKFRDFATSPLFYSGTYFDFNIAKTSFDERRESAIDFTFGTAPLTFGKVLETLVTSTSYYGIQFRYQQLYQIRSLSKNKMNTKVGGALTTNWNVRVNSSLRNNAVGGEGFFSLMASGQLTLDISNKKEKQIPLWITQFKIPSKKRELFYQLNIGLVNANFRNGFIYAGQSSLVNDMRLFDGYQFSFFDGLQFSVGLGYRFYLKNENGVQIGYNWSALTTSDKIEKFEMAKHQIKLVLMFNTRGAKSKYDEK